MKKYTICILIAVIFVMLFSFTVNAADNQMTSQKLYNDKIAELMDSIDDDTERILNDIGFSDFSIDEITNISISDVFKNIVLIFKDKISVPLKCFCTLLGVFLIMSVAESYISKDNRMHDYFSMVSVMFVALLVFSKVSQCISDAVAAIYSFSGFMKLLIPVMAGIITAGGKPTLAVSYSSVSIYVSEIMTDVCKNVLTPVLCMIASVSVCLSVNPVIKASPITALMKKTVNIVLGFFGTVFTGILSAKDILSASADSVSVKGLKFVLGSSVPVVGGAVSEGLSSVLAGITLMKNAVGVMALIVMAAISIPSIVEILAWLLMLTASSQIASSLGHDKTSEVISSLSFVISMLLSIIVFALFLTIISTAIVLTIGKQ